MSIRVEQRIWKADVFITFPQYGCQGEQLTLPWLPCDDNNVYIAYVLKANQAILPSVYSMKLYMRIFRFKTKSICLILVYLSWDAEWVVISGIVPIILYYKLYLSLNCRFQKKILKSLIQLVRMNLPTESLPCDIP